MIVDLRRSCKLALQLTAIRRFSLSNYSTRYRAYRESSVGVLLASPSLRLNKPLPQKICASKHQQVS